MTDDQNPGTLSLFRKEVEDFRNQRDRAVQVIRAEDVPEERDDFGRTRWLMHPWSADLPHHALCVFEVRLAPGERTGEMSHPGNLIWYAVRGQGRTVSSLGTFDWVEDDVLLFPPLPEGIRFHHENTGEQEAMLVAAFPNFVQSLGPEVGATFEVTAAGSS